MTFARSAAAAAAALLLLSAAPARGGAFVPSEPEAVDLAGIVLLGPNAEERPLSDVLPEGPAIVHFWATWCVPCRDELPAIDRFVKSLAEDGLADRIVIVSVDRLAYEKVQAFVRDQLGLPSLMSWREDTRRIGATFRLFFFPSTALLDGEHRLVGRHPGALDWDDPHIRSELMSHFDESD